MKPIFNLQEIPGKIVGNRQAPANPLAMTVDQTRVAKRAWRKAFPTPFVPKGVYRFNSHEEADSWMWKMISRPAKGN